MAELTNLNVTDASNTTRFPENMPPGNVNDSARALEGLLARGFRDAVEGDRTSAGSANAYTLTPNRTIGAYYTGQRHVFKASFSNTGAATLDVSGLGPKNIYKPTLSGLAALNGGEIQTNQYVDVLYDGTQFILLSMLPREWEQIERQVASASATIDFESLNSSVYESYRLRFSGVRPATDAAELHLRVGTGATPTYQSGASAYTYAGNFVGEGATVVGFGSAGASELAISGGNTPTLGNASTENSQGIIECGELDSAALHTVFHWRTVQIGPTSAVTTVTGGGRFAGATAVTALRLLCDSGNIAEGVFVLEGRRK